jgi:hypothetical protein
MINEEKISFKILCESLLVFFLVFSGFVFLFSDQRSPRLFQHRITAGAGVAAFKDPYPVVAIKFLG